MAQKFSLDSDYLVFTAHGTPYGVISHDIVSVIDMMEWTPVPNSPPEMRGVIPFREGNLPLFDLRVFLGSKARILEIKELVETMELRKQDHINWLNKLKDEVYNDKPISVQTNPHLCAFGKWYDTFTSDNSNLNSYMARFDTPHQAIHGIAIEAKKLIQEGKKEEAVKLVQSTERGLLASLLELFNGIGTLVDRYMQEYVVVFTSGVTQFAMVVDDIRFFSRLDHIEYPLQSNITGGDNDIVQAIGRYRRENSDALEDVLLMDISRFLDHFV
ncbi:MAG: CZB domain-containing protein [Magnetococcales bacterium]|nr:CZB domain-containing protein [Magnetococcales bacterium]MBF0631042.1 CZB domain-containing protein [Magnetococcales bacterium]